MLDVKQLDLKSSTINVTPSDNLFTQLGNNSYNYLDLLSELIDNSIAARNENELLKIVISIMVDKENHRKAFIYNDNAKGIPLEKLGDAISPGKIQTEDSLNEHGLGMKQAIAALGKLHYLCTKTKEDNYAHVIDKLGFGEINVSEIDWNQTNGTEICVTNLNSIVDVSVVNYTRTYVPFLGARYRRFLIPDDKKIQIYLRIINEDESERAGWFITEVKPYYFNPSKRTNAPVFTKYELKGNSWKAYFTFGYAPSSDEEYDELGLEKPTKYHPYSVSLKNQGFDVIFHDRVILFHQLSSLGITDDQHNRFNSVRGEIELISGFKTAITKNLMIKDEAFMDLISKIRAILEGKIVGPNGIAKEYLKTRTYPEELPEALYRDRLADYLRNDPRNPCSDVKTEYSVGSIDGYIDVLADGDAYELKVNQVGALEVFQLFMYMDVADINKGFIIGKTITTGGRAAIQHILEKHKKNIRFAELKQFPITDPPSKEDIEKYY